MMSETVNTGFKKGDLIWTEKPYVYVLNNTYRGSFCDYCLESNNALRRCSKCMFVYYCDKNCQKRAWAEHKQECERTKSMRCFPDSIVDSVLFIIRVLCKLKGPQVPQTIGSYSRSYDDLVSHFEKMNEDKASFMSQFPILKLLIGEENTPSLEDVIKILGKINANCIGIYGSQTMSIIGSGLYIGASIFDHSCDPDAVAVFRGPNTYVRATRDLSTRDVRKITIRYVESHYPKEQRRETLREKYFFTCNCIRCAEPEYDEYITKVLDERKAPKVIRRSEETEEKLNHMRQNGASASDKWRVLTKCLRDQDGILADSHYLRIQLLGDALNLGTQLGKYEESIDYGTRGLEPLKKVWGEMNPEVVTRLHRLCELHEIVGNKKASRIFSREAYELSSLLYGPEDPLTMKLKNMF